MEIMSPKTTTSYVPNDIIIDILSWVPAKSLLRLRWACKYWFHFITRDHDFIMKQFHRSITSTTIHPHNPSLLISKPPNPHLDYPCMNEEFQPCKIFQCYIDYSTTGSFYGRATNPILSGIFVKFHILGSCHGLILFSYYFREGQETILCLWNPCTKEYKYLPNPHGFDGYKTFGVATNFGLGYDHSIQDYKVIYNVNSLDSTIDHVQVYTLRTNSWRYIGSFAINVPSRFFGHGVFVNGALYFIHHHGSHGTRIFTLDLEKETYGEISNQPECLNDQAKSILGLTMFEGSLCLTMYTLIYDDNKIDDDRIENSVETWVMKKKDYNMNNKKEYSWSKLYEIPHHYGLLDNFLQPLRFTKDGEILLLDCKEGLVLCDPKNNKITINEDYKLHRIEEATDPHLIEAIYTESLVSLNSGTYIDEQGDYMHYWKDENGIDEEDYYMHYYRSL